MNCSRSGRLTAESLIEVAQADFIDAGHMGATRDSPGELTKDPFRKGTLPWTD